MFADGPPPYRPQRAGDSSSLTIAMVVVGVTVGLYALYRYHAPPQPSSPAPNTAVRGAPALRPSATLPSPQPAAPAKVSATRPAAEPGKPVSPDGGRATVYLCKGYAGDMFWSTAVCSSQRATIDRMTSVPAGLSFTQQVAIASGEAAEAARLHGGSAPARAGSFGGTPTHGASASECASFDRQIADLDKWALQPQSGQAQDWIRERRTEVMSARARRHC